MLLKDLVGKLPVHPKKKPESRKLSSIEKIVVHCSDWDITPEALAQYDIGPNHISSTGCPSITYSYLVQKDGTVCRTAPEEWVLWHAAGHNSKSLAVCLVYKTDSVYESGKVNIVPSDKAPSLQQMMALDELLTNLCLKLRVSPMNVVGHRELVGTGFIFDNKGHKRLKKTCPGRAVDLDFMRRNVTKGVQKMLKLGGLYNGTVDGVWGPKSQAALEQMK